MTKTENPIDKNLIDFAVEMYLADDARGIRRPWIGKEVMKWVGSQKREIGKVFLGVE